MNITLSKYQSSAGRDVTIKKNSVLQKRQIKVGFVDNFHVCGYYLSIFHMKNLLHTKHHIVYKKSIFVTVFMVLWLIKTSEKG